MVGLSEDIDTLNVYSTGFLGYAEMLGNCFDAGGRMVGGTYRDRLTSFQVPSPPRRRTVIVQCGAERVAAMRAAFTGRLADGLITDEDTARLLLAA